MCFRYFRRLLVADDRRRGDQTRFLPANFANYVLSFFTDAHQKALKERFVEVLREVDCTTAKAQIVLEKMSMLQGRTMWDTPALLPELTSLLLVKEEIQSLPSLLKTNSEFTLMKSKH